MIFSGRSLVLYKIGLRFFGYLAIPLSWLDVFLEDHPLSYQAASSYAVVTLKALRPEAGGSG